jgi:predicted phage terminase large subunit-like protein
MFKKKDFEVIDGAPEGLICARGWDLAGSKSTSSAWTVGAKLGMTRGAKPRIYVLDVVRLQGLPHEVDDLLLRTATIDGKACVQDIPQDPGQAGKAQVASFAALLTGFVFHFSPETGDKVTRAKPFASAVGGANVSVVRSEWTAAFINELCRFPAGTWRDQVDAVSRAFARLTLMRQGNQPMDVPAGVIT